MQLKLNVRYTNFGCKKSQHLYETYKVILWPRNAPISPTVSRNEECFILLCFYMQILHSTQFCIV